MVLNDFSKTLAGNKTQDKLRHDNPNGSMCSVLLCVCILKSPRFVRAGSHIAINMSSSCTQVDL